MSTGGRQKKIKVQEDGNFFAIFSKALKEHVLKCPKIGELRFPRWCSWCKKATEMTEEEKEKNELRDVAALSDHSYRCASWPVVVMSQEDDWISFEMELVENTKC
ncbi:hypothetical protein BG006_006431 [Podila minutissima]|uniref:Uncharacterized protein n=1 Tax=Podila minutissima TaxID=64525 RepID=A0A9P5SML7_9FUNG|nr:hypothetical protein BG006_006431 [Podila minutissima]